MTLEEIIECLNKHIQGKRAQRKLKNREFLVLQSLSKQHCSFKAYKEYSHTLWLVANFNRIPILKVNHVARVIDGNEERVKEEIDRMLIKMIFDLVHSTQYEDIINGTYKEPIE